MAPAESFRQLSVLVLTLAISIVFIAIIRGILIPLFLAAVATGLTYPLYRRIEKALGGRENAASLTTLTIVLLAIIVPLTVFLGVVAAQAVEVTQSIAPWLQQQLNASETSGNELPD